MSIYDKEYFERKKRRFAPEYSEERVYPRLMRVANFLNNIYHPKSILDVGCAKGFLVKAFLELGIKDVRGIDVSKYAIGQVSAEVRKKLQVVDVEKERIPFPDASFELIAALDLIEHLVNPKKALQEIYRVLKPGGKVCVTTPSPRSPNATLDPSHINVHDIYYWDKMFKEIGFKYKLIYQGAVHGRSKFPGKFPLCAIKIILYRILGRLRDMMSWNKVDYILLLTKKGK